MSIQSIKIKIGDTIHEMTVKEAKALKEALDDIFPQRMPQWVPPQRLELPPTWVAPTPYTDPLKPYCTTTAP